MYYAEAIVSGVSLYGSWPHLRDWAPADSESIGQVFGADGGPAW
jgi:hypothetical protein